MRLLQVLHIFYAIVRVSNKLNTLVALISMSKCLFIHKKYSSQHMLFHLIRFEIFPKHPFSSIKGEQKYQTHVFIQNHTVIWATGVISI